MSLKKKHFLNNLTKKGLPRFLSLTILLLGNIGLTVQAAEVPEAEYSGYNNAAAVIDNISYADVVNSNTWAKEAVYETGALDILKGYGDRQFGLGIRVSREQALAIAYRAAGREAEAQKAAEALDAARSADQKKKNPLKFWADGYLQLAFNDGLISRQDLNDAFNQDQTTLTDTSFYRGANAQRQEMAFWMAKILKLNPVYGQQKLFNSYSDWRTSDPVKIPYIEAVLQSNIMNGTGTGLFSPLQPLTREQAAQIIKNAAPAILPLLKLEKKVGSVESIASSADTTTGYGIRTLTVNIRNANGKLHRVGASSADTAGALGKNELNRVPLDGQTKELVVYKNGMLGGSSLLQKGDKLEYIVGVDKTVRFINVLSSSSTAEYVAVQVNSVNTQNLTMNITKVFKTNGPSIEMNRGNISFDFSEEEVNQTLRYSSNVSVDKNGARTDISQVTPKMNALLTVSNQVVTEIRLIDLKIYNKEGGVVKGIVEDIDTRLGYITLYNEDGSGTMPEAESRLIVFRNYSYTNPGDIEVFKNHEKAGMEKINIGDSVFIKLNDGGNIVSISAVGNYTVKYGQILAKTSKTLGVQYDDGSQQVLDIDENTLVVANKKLSRYDSLKEGDRIRLLLNMNNKFVSVSEITLEVGQHFITNIYKGVVTLFDTAGNKLVYMNSEVLDKGRWVRTGQKGAGTLKLADGYALYMGGSRVDAAKANKYLKNNEAYFVVEKDYGGGERVVAVSFRTEDDTEQLYDDSVVTVSTGAEEFVIGTAPDGIKYNAGTIVVKDGRLVKGSNISEGDTAYIVANRSYNSGDYFAGVVQISERPSSSFIWIYRGRVSAINETKDFTLGSFSQLDGFNWNYFSTPKTFKLTSATRIVNDTGVVNSREFLGYGSSSYVGKSLYVLSNGTNAELVNLAPYGVYNVRGIIQDITGGTTGDEGTVLTQPAGFTLRSAKVYDHLSNFTWEDSDDMTLNILPSSIILRNNKIAKPSDLKKGDRIRVLKKDKMVTGDAYIIIVEN